MKLRVVLRNACLAAVLLAVAGCGGGETSQGNPAEASPTQEQSDEAADSSLPPDPRAPRSRGPVGRGPDGAVPTPTLRAQPGSFEETVSYPDGLEVEVVSVTPDRLEGRGPGELRGDVTVVEVRLTNSGASPVELGGVVVSLDYGRGGGRAASPTSTERTQDFVGGLEPGVSAEARYAFFVDEGMTGRARLTVDVDGEHVPATFLRGGF